MESTDGAKYELDEAESLRHDVVRRLFLAQANLLVCREQAQLYTEYERTTDEGSLFITMKQPDGQQESVRYDVMLLAPPDDDGTRTALVWQAMEAIPDAGHVRVEIKYDDDREIEVVKRQANGLVNLLLAKEGLAVTERKLLCKLQSLINSTGKDFEALSAEDSPHIWGAAATIIGEQVNRYTSSQLMTKEVDGCDVDVCTIRFSESMDGGVSDEWSPITEVTITNKDNGSMTTLNYGQDGNFTLAVNTFNDDGSDAGEDVREPTLLEKRFFNSVLANMLSELVPEMDMNYLNTYGAVLADEWSMQEIDDDNKEICARVLAKVQAEFKSKFEKEYGVRSTRPISDRELLKALYDNQQVTQGIVAMTSPYIVKITPKAGLLPNDPNVPRRLIYLGTSILGFPGNFQRDSGAISGAYIKATYKSSDMFDGSYYEGWFPYDPEAQLYSYGGQN